jgi:hypothetical protein
MAMRERMAELAHLKPCCLPQAPREDVSGRSPLQLVHLKGRHRRCSPRPVRRRRRIPCLQLTPRRTHPGRILPRLIHIRLSRVYNLASSYSHPRLKHISSCFRVGRSQLSTRKLTIGDPGYASHACMNETSSSTPITLLPALPLTMMRLRNSCFLS